jgi:protein subunit release factor B
MTKRVCTVTMKDLEIQTFCTGGKGGQNQNKNQTGVRLIHHPSGARGESREFKSQLQNKRAALRRLAQTKEFVLWAKKMAGISVTNEEEVNKKINKMMDEKNLKIEARNEKKWTTISSLEALPQ